MSVNWIEYKEKKLLFINVANLMNDHHSLKTDLETLVALLKKEPKNSVLALADLRNTHLSDEALIALMSHAPRAVPYFRKSALVIGANYSRSIVLDSFRFVIDRLPKRFSDLDAAKEWLVSE
jgi:hypothetical protein